MFLVRNKKQVGEKIYKTVLLRESYREGNKVKKRTIANLSGRSEQEINAIDWALKNKNFKLPLAGEEFKILQGRSVGSVYLLHEIAKRLGIIESLGSSYHAKLA